VSVLFLIQGPEQVASSRTRAFAYLPHLAKMGVETEALVWNSEAFVARQRHGAVPAAAHVMNTLRHAGIALRAWWAARRHEVVYVQKVILPGWFLRSLKRGGRRLVFDYDDALYALAPGADRGPRALLRRHRMRRFTACLSAADLVVIENEPNRMLTEQYCANTLTITGPIDTDRYRPAVRERRGEVVLGWIGSPSTTSYLRMLEPVVRDLASRYSIALHLIGAGTIDIPGVAVRSYRWSLEDEVRNLATFDVGLMPLTDDPWSRGKGGYKILQYMAMGIPTVASPVGINAGLVRHGETGLLASSAEQWRAALERLVVDADERERMGRAARADAVSRFSLAHYAPVFAEALLPRREVASASFGIEGARP
jgi:glycosyltransferase involved in cell wall biosynthesis